MFSYRQAVFAFYFTFFIPSPLSPPADPENDKKTPSIDGAGRLFLMNFQPGFLDYLTTRRGVVLPFKTCTWLWGLGGLEIDYYK